MFYRELKALPEATHLFCPRKDDDDHGRYEDLEQVDEAGKAIKDIVAESTARRESFLSSMRILAYHKDGVEDDQNWVPVSYTHLTLPTICSV